MQLPYFVPFYTAHPALLSAGLACGETEAAKNWYLNDTVRIYGRVLEENGKLSIDSFLGGGDCWSIPFLRHSMLAICSIPRVAPKLLKNALGQGFYCNLHFEKLDFSSLCRALDPQTKDATIYGFDETENGFFLSGAAATGPHRFFLPSSLLLEEAQSCTEKRDGTIEFLRPQPKEQPLLPEKIRKDLAEYIGGVPYAEAPPESCIAAFSGVDTADFLSFFPLAADRFAAKRALRLQTEHRACMTKRLFSLERQRVIKEGLAPEYLGCAEMFSRLSGAVLQGERISSSDITIYKDEERAVLRKVLDSMGGQHEN